MYVLLNMNDTFKKDVLYETIIFMIFMLIVGKRASWDCEDLSNITFKDIPQLLKRTNSYFCSKLLGLSHIPMNYGRTPVPSECGTMDQFV